MGYPIYHSAYTAAQIEAAIGKGPRVNASGYWEVWNVSTGAYESTGVGAGVTPPTVVTQVSQMTNHGYIYIYNGAETGYTAGYWYYWDGSAWTAGGAYQVAATDPTLSIAGAAADAKVTGDTINSVKSEMKVDAALLDNDINNTSGSLEDFDGYIHSSNKWIYNTAYQFILLIVQPGDSVVIQKNATRDAIYAWLASYNFKNGGSVDYVEDTGLVTISSDSEVSLTAPDGVKYLYIFKSSANGANYHVPKKLTINGVDRLVTASKRESDNVNSVRDTAEFDIGLINNDINGDGFPFTRGGYIHSTNIWSGIDTGSHYIFLVAPGDIVEIKRNAGADCYYAWLTDYDCVMGQTPDFVSGTARIQISDTSMQTLTVPETAKYLYVLKSIGTVSYAPFVLNINETDRTTTIIGKLNDGVTVSKVSATAFVIQTGKGTHKLEHETIDAKFLDTWRLTQATVLGSELWHEVDVEGPIKEAGEDDYMSGYHGDEQYTDAVFLADGREIDFDNMAIGTVLNCDNFTACVTSNVYYNEDTENKAFIRYKRLVFEGNTLRIYNTYKYVGSNPQIEIDVATGTGLYPVSTNVVEGYITNTGNVLIANQTTNRNAHLDEVAYVGEGFTINVKVISGKTDAYYGAVYYEPQNTRYKLYFFQHYTYGTDYLVLNQGDEIHSGYEIEFV